MLTQFIQSISQPIIEFYDTREPREQIILIIGLPVLIILLYYLLVWDPVSLKNEKLHNDLQKETRFSEWFDQRTQTVKKSAQSFNWKNNSLPTIIEKSLQDHKITPWKKRIFQNSNEEIVVSFEGIAYSKIAIWLTDLHEKYQVVFKDASIIATKKSGTVDCKFTFASSLDSGRTSNAFQQSR